MGDGKGTFAKILQENYQLDKLGNVNAILTDATHDVAHSIFAFYGAHRNKAYCLKLFHLMYGKEWLIYK